MFVVCIVFTAMLSITVPINAQVNEPVHVANQIVVKLAPGTDIEDLHLGLHYTVIENEENLNAYLLGISGISEEYAIQELSTRPGVSFAELNVEFHTSFEPNDPLWIYQYGPKNIKCPGAWDIERGETSVVVSVIDTGIDYTHPDLVHCYKASGSWNFIAHNSNPLDDCGHGTHCAGIIAAEADNGIGIAGIADVKIIAMKVFTADGAGFLWTICRGIVRSTLVGADVISMSFGAMPLFRVPRLMWAACNFSYDLGVTLVAATGNENSMLLDYPARFPCVIAVGAVDVDNVRAEFSNYGAGICVMAPGVHIISTLPTYNVMLNNPPYNIPMNYGNLSGTSMACPHVAGVIALYLSKNGVRVSNDKIRQRLEESAIDLGTPGFDDFNGYGLVNATKMLQYDDNMQIDNMQSSPTNLMNNDNLAGDSTSKEIICLKSQCGHFPLYSFLGEKDQTFICTGLH